MYPHPVPLDASELFSFLSLLEEGQNPITKLGNFVGHSARHLELAGLDACGETFEHVADTEI